MGLSTSNSLSSLLNCQQPSGTLLTGFAPPRQGLGVIAAQARLGILGTLPQLGAIAAPPRLGILGALSSVPVPAVGPKWSYVIRRFQSFNDSLALTSTQETDAWTKIHGVVSCLNTAYYGYNSQTANAFLIGSWAKETRIRPPRDIDLYFLLPNEVYNRFERYGSGVNKQSALLQEVKSKLLVTYHTTNIRGDGPVVMVGFTSYSVEVVPAFLYDRTERSYYVTDTKNGGSYKKTTPLHEVDGIVAADSRNANNVRRLVRMLKAWQAWCSVPIKSFYLELLAIEFMDQYVYRHQGYFYYDWLSRDFFRWMIDKSNSYVFAPGTFDLLRLGDAWKSRAESAYARAAKACDYERDDEMSNAGLEWQKIFGSDIPIWIL